MALRVPAPRSLPYQAVHFISARLLFGNTSVITVGTIPAGAQIIRSMSGVMINTVFNAGTANTLNIGFAKTSTTAADDDFYGTALALGTSAFVPLDEVVSGYVSVDTTITATSTQSGTAPTTGDATIVIAFLPAVG